MRTCDAAFALAISCSPHRVADRDTIPRNGAGDPSALITDPCLNARVYRGVCSDIRGRSGNRRYPGIYPDLWCSDRVTV